ncbi:hypothetical protein WAF17_06990 [Bernardetia sp. ABR2-2B]|uniref:hypothetical protein n=1 Tax=Bernardetia sp. ABR2-2B TaxID=3127472 RepID=UPI0030D4E332
MILLKNFYLKNISIIGRVAIGIECLELMIKEELKTDTFDYVISFLQEFVENEDINIADWEELSAELMPCCINDSNYSVKEFEIISENTYTELKKWYEEIGEDCRDTINKIIEIASLYFYTIIPLYSFETIILTNDILNLCKKNTGYIPNIDAYRKMKFSENGGWGISMKIQEIKIQ